MKLILRATLMDKGTTIERWVFTIIDRDTLRHLHLGLMYHQAFHVLTVDYNMPISQARFALGDARRNYERLERAGKADGIR